ncbi:hypothetical protein [Sodalis ligni]|nr:hypothetical protein [Sodalis ligni]
MDISSGDFIADFRLFVTLSGVQCQGDIKVWQASRWGYQRID